jgi:PPE-repeat protein
MRGVLLFSLAIATISSAAVAQSSAPIVATPSSPSPPVASQAAITAAKVEVPRTGTTILPSNTEVLLRLEEEVNSKKFKVGDPFRLSVLQDVMLGNFVVIPRGTPATGTVTYRTGKGGFGKSGKMEVEMRSINLNGRAITITGHFRQEGEGNTGATVGVAVAAGPFAVLVKGRSAIFTRDREFRAFTGESIPVVLPN